MGNRFLIRSTVTMAVVLGILGWQHQAAAATKVYTAWTMGYRFSYDARLTFRPSVLSNGREISPATLTSSSGAVMTIGAYTMSPLERVAMTGGWKAFASEHWKRVANRSTRAENIPPPQSVPGSSTWFGYRLETLRLLPAARYTVNVTSDTGTDIRETVLTSPDHRRIFVLTAHYQSTDLVTADQFAAIGATLRILPKP